MNDLIVFEKGLVPVYETSKGEKVVDGRELWKALKNKTDFSDWVKRRLDECDAVEKADFEVFLKNKGNLKGGRPTSEYIIKLATAKEMAMLERNEIGKQVRKYFISVEEKFQETYENLSPTLQLFNQMFKAVAQQDVRLNQIETSVTATNQRLDNMGEIISLDPNDWRNQGKRLIVKIAQAMGGYDFIKEVNNTIYELLDKRFGVSLETRLTNKRRRMSEEGVCKSKRDKTNKVDIIAEDKKLIEGYVAIIKEMAVKYGVDLAS